MYFQFIVQVECERTEGKFAAREELEQLIQEELQGTIDNLQLEGEAGGQYEVTTSEVSHDDQAIAELEAASKKARAARRREAKKAAAAETTRPAHSFAATMSPEGCACGCGGRTPLA